MSGSEQVEEDPDLEPWVKDDRLKDYRLQGTINKVVKLILRLAEAMKKAPIGPMPETESIPMLWEKVKDLKQDRILDLQNAWLRSFRSE